MYYCYSISASELDPVGDSCLYRYAALCGDISILERTLDHTPLPTAILAIMDIPRVLACGHLVTEWLLLEVECQTSGRDPARRMKMRRLKTKTYRLVQAIRKQFEEIRAQSL